MKFLILLFLIAGCSDRCPDLDYYQQAKINDLTRENENLRAEIMKSNYCPQPIIIPCEENKLKVGCEAFKSNLEWQSVRLTSSQWSFCEKYKDGK